MTASTVSTDLPNMMSLQVCPVACHGAWHAYSHAGDGFLPFCSSGSSPSDPAEPAGALVRAVTPVAMRAVRLVRARWLPEGPAASLLLPRALPLPLVPPSWGSAPPAWLLRSACMNVQGHRVDTQSGTLLACAAHKQAQRRCAPVTAATATARRWHACQELCGACNTKGSTQHSRQRWTCSCSLT